MMTIGKNKHPIDLTGLDFGYYHVLGLAEPRYSPKGKKQKMWVCRCVCGKINEVFDGHLKSRKNISCGCMKKTTLIDLTGKTFGYLRVDSRAESKPKGNGKFQTMWNCTCLACGKKVVKSSYDAQHQGSCKCTNIKRYQINRTIDFTGQKVGRLYIEKRVEDYVKPGGGSDRRWQCVCDCGRKCIKTTYYLHRSPTPSCGCWKAEVTSKIKTRDLIGISFGYLIPLEKFPSKRTSGNNPKVMYFCGCFNCGGTAVVSSNNLINGLTRSCGCIKSFGETEVRKELNKRNIRYETEYSFKDLYLNSKNNPLRFDFAIFDERNNLQFLIEYQGAQHYNDVNFGKQERETTDQMKKDYCSAHNISLYEIRYDEKISDSIDNIITSHVNSVPSSEISEKA